MPPLTITPPPPRKCVRESFWLRIRGSVSVCTPGSSWSTQDACGSVVWNARVETSAWAIVANAALGDRPVAESEPVGETKRVHVAAIAGVAPDDAYSCTCTIAVSRCVDAGD